MRTSEKCRALFWEYKAGERSRKEMDEELDKLEDKQESLSFNEEDNEDVRN